MAEQSANKNAFILTWLKDTRDADKPIENDPDTKVPNGYQEKEVEYLICEFPNDGNFSTIRLGYNDYYKNLHGYNKFTVVTNIFTYVFP
jgi:hypothetical protein